jgi:hypothetical protein
MTETQDRITKATKASNTQTSFKKGKGKNKPDNELDKIAEVEKTPVDVKEEDKDRPHVDVASDVEMPMRDTMYHEE